MAITGSGDDMVYDFPKMTAVYNRLTSLKNAFVQYAGDFDGAGVPLASNTWTGNASSTFDECRVAIKGICSELETVAVQTGSALDFAVSHMSGIESKNVSRFPGTGGGTTSV